MPDPYTPSDYVEDLRTICVESASEDQIFERLAPLAQRLATSPEWLEPDHYQTDAEQGFGVHLLHEEPDHTLAVFVVSWEPGRGAGPHDHGTWAVVAGIEGEERNVRYQRLDDRSRPGQADIDVKREFAAGPGEVICIRTGGIHAVWNDTDTVSLSLHTYGKHVNHTGRSQFDPETGAQTDFIVAVS